MDSNDILFFKIWRNKWINKIIFDNFKNLKTIEFKNESNYYLGFRINFSKLNKLKWFIENNRIPLLLDFINNSSNEVTSNEKALRLLINKVKDYKTLSTVLTEYRIISADPGGNLMRASIFSNNINSVLVILNDLKFKLNDNKGEKYLYHSGSKEMFQVLFNQILKENNIEMKQEDCKSNATGPTKNILIIELFKSLFSKINDNKTKIMTLLKIIVDGYSSLVNLEGMLNNPTKFFQNDLNIQTLKTIVNKRIYIPKEALKIYQVTIKDNLSLEEIRIFIDVIFLHHHKYLMRVPDKVKKEIQEIDQLFDNRDISEIKAVALFLNILHQNLPEFDTQFVIPTIIDGVPFYIKNKFTNIGKTKDFFENSISDALPIMCDLFTKSYLELNFNINLDKIRQQINQPFDSTIKPSLLNPCNNFIKFLIKYKRMNINYPNNYIESILNSSNASNLPLLNYLFKYNLIEFKDLNSVELSIYKNCCLDILKWYLEIKKIQSLKNKVKKIKIIAGQFPNRCLKSIEEIDYVKDNIEYFKTLNIYPDYNSSDLLIHFSNNFNFDNVSRLPRIEKIKKEDLEKWINHLNQLKFKCFDNLSFTFLILRIQKSSNHQVLNNIDFSILSNQLLSFLFFSSTFNLNLKFLKIVYIKGLNCDIGKLNLQDYFKNSIKNNFNYSFKSIYNSNSKKIKEIMEFTDYLFEILPRPTIQTLNIVFENIYQRLLVSKDITIDKVLPIKNYFMDNGVFINDSSSTTHLYLSIKSKRFEKYIKQYLHDSPRIDIDFYLKLFDSIEVPDYGKLSKVYDIKYLQEKITFLKGKYNQSLNIENIVSKDFNQLLLDLRSQNNFNFLPDWIYFLEIQNLELLEKLLVEKKQGPYSSDIPPLIDKLNKYFEYQYIESILKLFENRQKLLKLY